MNEDLIFWLCIAIPLVPLGICALWVFYAAYFWRLLCRFGYHHATFKEFKDNAIVDVCDYCDEVVGRSR